MEYKISARASGVTPSLTLAIDAKAKQLKAEGLDVVGFGAGEPDFDTPQHIKEAAWKALSSGFTKYTPSSGLLALRQAVVEKFKKDNGIWTLQGYPHFYVYQKRIRSFLSALMEASFYEKKSNKMEHLGLFGLTPINADNSSAVRIELATATGKNIVAFEVGKYDLDLGRGSRGAYIKFDNRFQVWLVAMDLIDLSLTPESWTFSSIWNLRFGRIAAINNATDIDYKANITKYLLNTYFTNTTSTLNHPQLLQTLNITSEGNNYTTINFYRSDNKIWLSYEFRQPITENSLQSFAECAKGIFYQISDQQWEKIKNAILNPSTSQSS